MCDPSQGSEHTIAGDILYGATRGRHHWGRVVASPWTQVQLWHTRVPLGGEDVEPTSLVLKRTGDVPR